jgi:hypothetical protein
MCVCVCVCVCVKGSRVWNIWASAYNISLASSLDLLNTAVEFCSLDARNAVPAGTTV